MIIQQIPAASNLYLLAPQSFPKPSASLLPIAQGANESAGLFGGSKCGFSLGSSLPNPAN